MDKNHAGSATGIDLAELTRYDFFETDDDDELRVEPTGRWVRFEDVEALARATRQHPEALSNAEFLSKRLARVAKLAGAHIPEHFTHEQVAEVAGTILGSIAQNLEKAATPQHSVTEQSDDAQAFDAAIAAGTLVWDHKATARAIAYAGFKAARAQPLPSTAATAPTEPVRLSEEHPNLKVPTDPACSAKLDELGDDRGQGLDPYWKFGFRTGWHHGVRSLMASTAASEQQASVSEQAEFVKCKGCEAITHIDNPEEFCPACAALSGRATIPSEAGDSVLAPIINAVEMHDATCLNSTIPDETLIWTATSVMGEQLHVTLGDFRRIAAMAALAIGSKA